MVRVSLLLLCCLAGLRAQGVLDTGEIGTIGCKGDCATLELTTANGSTEQHKGTNNKVKIKDVVKARVVGTGCFMVHKSKDFKGSKFLVEGGNEYLLKDHISWTTVK